MQTGNRDFIYKTELDKACFQHDMTFGKANDLVRRTQSDKVLTDKAFKIASDPKYDGYQRGLASMVYKFVIKNLVGVALLMKQIISWQMNFISQLLENSKKEKYIHHLDNIWGVDLADMQSLSRYNKGIRYLLCAINLFSKYAWVIP